MRLQDFLCVFHLRTTLVVQLFMKLDSRSQWPERNQEGGGKKIKQTQTYNVKDHVDDDDDVDDDGDGDDDDDDDDGDDDGDGDGNADDGDDDDDDDDDDEWSHDEDQI